MKERRHEINIHKDLLRAQIKSAEEERQTVSSELHERISKIDKLRKRCVYCLQEYDHTLSCF